MTQCLKSWELECPLILPCTAEVVDVIRSSVFMLTVSSSSSEAPYTIHSQHITLVTDLFLFLDHG